jgi:hypothetical protein
VSVALRSRFGIRGLEDLWAALTGRAPRAEMSMAERMILDVLGLGLEQAIGHLAAACPDLDAFEDWAVATAGEPDPDTIARYHAWLDGVPPPESVRARLRAIGEAEPVLDADDLAHWQSEGWVILRGAIPPDQAAAAAALLWKIAGADPGDPGTWYGGARTNGLMVQHFQGEELEAARRSPRVHKAFAQLWGTSDLWTKIDRMSFNAPVRPGKRFYAPRLHWDVSLAQPIPFATQGILYLTDTAADQGALELVPGMHNWIGAWLDGIGEADPRQVDISARAITIPAGAGDLVIWHQGLPHGASPNRAALPRLAQYLNLYSPDMHVHPEWR